MKGDSFLSSSVRAEMQSYIKDYVFDCLMNDSDYQKDIIDNGFVGNNKLTDRQLMARYKDMFSCLFEDETATGFKDLYDKALSERAIHDMITPKKKTEFDPFKSTEVVQEFSLVLYSFDITDIASHLSYKRDWLVKRHDRIIGDIINVIKTGVVI